MNFFAALQLQPDFFAGNFELYQDRAPELFNRARAKLLLEIEGRPIIRLLRCLDRVRRRLKESNRSGPGAWKPKIVLDWLRVIARESLLRDGNSIG